MAISRYLPDVKVLAPDSLRQRVKERLLKAIEQL